MCDKTNTKHIHTFTVSAPGKIHLSGEHSVVYGKPALLCAIGKRVYATATCSPKDCYQNNLAHSYTFGPNNAQIKNSANHPNSVNLSNSSSTLNLPNRAIEKTYAFLQKKPPANLYITLTSDLITGCGMGSSAAVSAAIVGALFCLEQEAWDLQKINQIVYETEKIMHGNPSGADNTTIVHGGLVYYQKKESSSIIKQLQVPSCFELSPSYDNNNSDALTSPGLLIIDSGKPSESTKEMVHIVAKNFASKKNKYQTLFDQIGHITEHMTQNITPKCDIQTLGKLFAQNQRLLEQLGVVGNKARHIIKTVEKHNCWAKISGAGGIQTGSGIIIALTPDITTMKNLEAELTKEKISFFKTTLSQEGLKKEEKLHA